MTTTPPFHPPLALHVVWHPAFTAGRDLAHALYRHLSRDVHQPRFRGLGIPVFFRSLPGPGAGDLPLPVPVDGAEHTAVVVLVDDELVVDERWEAYLLSRKCANMRTILFLPRRVLLTTFVSDRRHFPGCIRNHSRCSAAVTGRTRHG